MLGEGESQQGNRVLVEGGGGGGGGGVGDPTYIIVSQYVVFLFSDVMGRQHGFIRIQVRTVAVTSCLLALFPIPLRIMFAIMQ